MLRAFKCFLFPIACLLTVVTCATKEDIDKRVKELIERTRRLYGETETRAVKQWELDADDAFTYPNGNRQRLAEVSHLWINYYRCTSRVVNSMTSSGHLPSGDVTVYEGEVARLPCDLCVAPGEDDLVTWFYAESIQNATFAPLRSKSTVVCDVNVTIYDVRLQDAGVYRCRLRSATGGLVVLQVLDDHEYSVINVGSYQSTDTSVRATSATDLVTFISWSPWGQCSRCDRAGHRRRHGTCYTRLNDSMVTNITRCNDSIFKEFRNGIACRSWLLPAAHRNDPLIAGRRNVIMTEPCENPCKQVFEVRSKKGELLERANNSGGMFSLRQSPPPTPPPPGRTLIFIPNGDRLTLKCPGTTLRDIPITWRRGTQRLAAGPLDRLTGGRVRLNARDQIVFASVGDDDADVYR